MKKCPMCAEEIQDEARVCKHCRYDFSEKKMIGDLKVVKHDKWIAFILAVFLGGFGAHKFYLGKNGQGVFYILFCWTFLPLLFSLLEALTYALISKEQFALEYDR